MTTYLAIPLTALTLLVSFGCVILTIGRQQRANRFAGTLLLGAGYWAFCEVLWNATSDVETAVLLHRLALPGILFIGPLALSLMSEVTSFSVHWRRPFIRGYTVVCAGFLIAGLTTPYVIADMTPTSWGYGAVTGPLFTAWLVTLLVAIVIGSGFFVHSALYSGNEAEREHGPVALGLILAAFTAGAISDAALPMLGYQLPRVGTLCFGVAGVGMFWAMQRYGYSLLSYRDFARRILRTLPNGLVLTTVTGRVRIANDEIDRLLGCNRGAAVGRPLAEILDVDLFHPLREVNQLEAQLRRDDGSWAPVLVSSTKMLDNDRSLMGLVVVVTSQQEMVSLRNRLMTSDRLAAVGQLAAGIAHEINNPLAFVRSNLNLMRVQWRAFDDHLDELGVDGALREDTREWADLLEESLEGVDRAATTVADVKDFSHVGVGETVRADLVELLEHVIRMAGPQLAGRVEVVRDYAEVSPIWCLPQRLKQLFLNLVVNSAQAIEEAGHIWISISERESTVCVRVEDDGVGIPEQMRERIYDPFFTTKPVGEGTGLGLAISHEIVRAHGGAIAASSRPGGGTCFEVWLPRSENAEPGEPE